MKGQSQSILLAREHPVQPVFKQTSSKLVATDQELHGIPREESFTPWGGGLSREGFGIMCSTAIYLQASVGRVEPEQ